MKDIFIISLKQFCNVICTYVVVLIFCPLRNAHYPNLKALFMQYGRLCTGDYEGLDFLPRNITQKTSLTFQFGSIG